MYPAICLGMIACLVLQARADHGSDYPAPALTG
jgi:hypothetical protein